LRELATTGRYQPRLETTTHSGHQSRAADIADFAERVLNMPLMSWQRHCLEGLTAFDDDGKWLHRIGLISVARQNGKSLLSSAVIGHWLTKETELRGQPQTVISVSHKLDLTAAQFNYLAPILEAKFGAEVSWSYGRQKVTMPNGSVWHIRAATPAAGHGYSCDLITADEVWQISEAAIDDGLLPSQRARRNPLCLLVSTAGTQESTALLRWRDQGLKAIDTGEKTNLYFAEFSPPPTLDPMTVEAWEYANPALAGGLIEMDVIQGEAQGPNRSAFLRASVNLWQAVSNGWLAPGVFEALSTEEKAPPGGVLAVEMALDESTYTAVRAVQVDNKTHVVLAFVAETVTELWEKVEQQIAENPNLKLAIVPVLENSCPLKYETRRVIVGYKELLKWTSAVRAMILENKLTHNNQQLLNSHVERAVLIREKNGITVSSLRSPGPIEACRCMIWAAALAARPQAIGKPVIVTNYR
jgi:phage terminase large subunit-like protein